MMVAWGDTDEQALDALKRAVVREFGNLEFYEMSRRHPYNHQMETVVPLREYVIRG